MASDTLPLAGEMLLYQTEDGRTRLQVVLDNQTLWLNQKQLMELFGKAKTTISEHIAHIFEDGELMEEAVVRFFRTTAADGKQYEVAYYHLDMVLALGYRVRSPAGMRFRQWASDKLKEYIIKGFVLDDERLKNPGKGPDYFDELTRRLQDIRTSERRFYQKITDIYATSVDYDPSHSMTKEFFATVQNKVHYAIHGYTSTELISQRANSALPNMGLTNWEGTRIHKDDVSIAKNYLHEDELRAMNNLAEQYLIFAESQAERRVPMTMRDWIKKLEGFLTLNDREILQNAGNVSARMAKEQAEREYEVFRVIADRQLESDFDRMVKQLPKPKGGRSSGFTLVEVMIAGSLGTVLALVLFQILMQAQHMADVMIMQSTLNSQAREVFELLMDGRGNTQLTGYHGRNADPFVGEINLSRQNDARNALTFRLGLGPAGGTAIRTRETIPFNVTCSGVGTPVKTCAANNQILNVDGYIDEFGSKDAFYSNPPDPSYRTSEVTFTIIDPQQIPHSTGDSRFIQSEYSSSYWTVFSLNKDVP